MAKVREGKLAEIRPQSENSNMHTERGTGMLKRSIQQDRIIGAITVAANGETISGSNTQEVLADMGIEDAIYIEDDGSRPIVLIRTDIPNAQTDEAKRLGVAANRVQAVDYAPNVPLLAEYGDQGLLEQLYLTDELSDMLKQFNKGNDGNLPKPGSGGDEFDPMANDGPTRAHRGDIWRMGPHLMMCGDSTDQNDVLRLASYAGKVALVVTSPPYGVGKEYEQGEDRAGLQKWTDLIDGAFRMCKFVCPTWFVNLANKRTGNDGFELNTFGIMTRLFEEMKMGLIALRIWQKPPAWAIDGPYWRSTYKAVDDFEFLALYSPLDQKPRYLDRLGEPDNTDWAYRGIWNMASVHSNREHGAQFPVELPSRAIRMLTDPSEWVYDPFFGTGTTMVAAHRLGRVSLGMELSPAYCDVALSKALAEGIGPIEKIGTAQIG